MTPGLWVLASLVASPPLAEVPEPVAVVPFEYQGEAPGLSAGFRRLLEVELSRSVKLVSVASEPCGELACAVKAARSVGARAVVFGTLVELGRKVQVVAVTAEVESGRTVSMADIAVGSYEELDVAAERLAPALVGTGSIEGGAKLGSITTEEAKADVRRDGDSTFNLRLAGITPVGDGYSGTSAGLEVGAGIGFETRNVLIEPRVAFRWSIDPEGRGFYEVPIDIGAYYIASLGDVAPFIGGGLGIRYITDRREREVVTGQIIKTESRTEVEDTAWAFGGFARVGLMLMRTYEVRLSLSLDYNLALTELNGVSNPQAVSLGIGVHF